jgi:hypothetical protein
MLAAPSTTGAVAVALPLPLLLADDEALAGRS